MAVEDVSRKSAEQVFTLYARGLHPELFDIYVEREVFRDFYSASFWVIGSSHVVTFRTGKNVITEILADEDRELPVQRKIGGFSFGHNPQKRFSFDNGISYDARFGYPNDFTIADEDTFVRDFEVLRYADESP